MSYTDQQSIGHVTEVSGNAKIIHPDGTEESITLGTKVYQGDVIETSGDGAVNVKFIDESSFAVSDNARVAMDEFVFDPQSESGAQDFSVMQGVFMYTSGLIGRENPDSVGIETPVGSIGIRGTIIGGRIAAPGQGESQITVIEGAIVVRNEAGEQLLSNQFDTVRLLSNTVAPSAVEAMDVHTVAKSYAAIKDVSAELFSSFNDQMQQQQQSPVDGLDGQFMQDDTAPEDEQKDKDAGNQLQGEAPREQALQAPAEDAMNRKVAQDDWNTKHNIDKIQNLAELQNQLINQGLTLKDITITDGGVPLNNILVFGSISSTNTPTYIAQNKQIISTTATDEIAQISSSLEYQFDRPSSTYPHGVDAVIPINKLGAIITRIDVYDSQGETFSVGDFSVIASNSMFDNLFKIIQVGNEFFLALESGVKFTGLKFADPSGTALTAPISTINPFNEITVLLKDGGNGDSQTLSLGFGNVTQIVAGGSPQNATGQIIMGTNIDLINHLNGNDNITLNYDTFKVINGGDGIDHLHLANSGTTRLYDFSSNVSNIGTGLSRDLSSIEQIFFQGANDKVKLDLNNILNLLKTSDVTVNGQHEFVISTNVTGTNVNGVYFVDDTGAATNLIAQGFTHNPVPELRGPNGSWGNYDIYQHATLGVVAIESTINGAQSGGL